MGLPHWYRFANLGFSTLTVEKRRVDGQIIERVAGVAIAFNDAPTGAGLERDVLLSLGANAEKHHNRANKDAPHGVYTTLMVSGRGTLLWYPAALKISSSACVWPRALLAFAIT